jgi:hypothetical protein
VRDFCMALALNTKGVQWRVHGRFDFQRWSVFRYCGPSGWMLISFKENSVSGAAINSRFPAVRLPSAFVYPHLVFRFTVRNITINGAQTAVYSSWNWGESTFRTINFSDCDRNRMDVSRCQD